MNGDKLDIRGAEEGGCLGGGPLKDEGRQELSNHVKYKKISL